MAHIKPVLYSEEGEEIALPTRFELCPHCEGRGKSSAYLGAITQSDREPGGAWEDPDDFEDYMRGGYDKTCDRCNGLRVVEVPDFDRMTESQRAEWNERVSDERAYERECEMERRMGC